MSEWRTIDSAPKDGTEFLGWKERCEHWHWQNAEGSRPVGWRNFMWVYSEEEGPTHWQPLPPPPDSDRPAAPEVQPLSDGAILEIKGAIKATEYKYFGDYELSDEQQTAVSVLVAAAEMLIARITLSQQANEERG